MSDEPVDMDKVRWILEHGGTPLPPPDMKHDHEAFGDGCNAKVTIDRLTAELAAERDESIIRLEMWQDASAILEKRQTELAAEREGLRFRTDELKLRERTNSVLPPEWSPVSANTSEAVPPDVAIRAERDRDRNSDMLSRLVVERERADKAEAELRANAE